MDNLVSKNQLIEEISLIPEDKHKELYDLIHEFRMSINQSENNINKIMQFAGSWSDISEEEFIDFCEESAANQFGTGIDAINQIRTQVRFEARWLNR